MKDSNFPPSRVDPYPYLLNGLGIHNFFENPFLDYYLQFSKLVLTKFGPVLATKQGFLGPY